MCYWEALKLYSVSQNKIEIVPEPRQLPTLTSSKLLRRLIEAWESEQKTLNIIAPMYN